MPPGHADTPNLISLATELTEASPARRRNVKILTLKNNG